MSAPLAAQFIPRATRFIRLAAHYAFRRSRVGYPPFTLIVEPTNVCNLKCRMCFESSMKRPRGFLEAGLAEVIAEKAHEAGIRHVQFAFGGEPTLHPQLPRLVALFQDKKIAVELFTNATRLDADVSRQLIDARLAMINFSVDGFDASTFERIRPPAKFADVLDNVRQFDAIKRAAGAALPYRRLYVTPQEANAAQINAGMPEEVFGPYVDGYYYNAPNNWTGAVGTEVIGAQETTDCRRCMYVWVMMVVSHDGIVVPCPCDYDLSYVLGDIREMSFPEMWRGERMAVLRKMGAVPSEMLPEMCRKCLWRKASNPVGLLLKRVRSEVRMLRGT